MPLLSWKPEYSVHEAALDSHHQKLFSLLNTVYEKVMNSSEIDCAHSMIDELTEYTEYHFSAEEHHMRAVGFQGLADHMTKHADFINKLDDLKNRYHESDLEIARELIVLLGEWLLQHVIKCDKMYVKPFHS